MQVVQAHWLAGGGHRHFPDMPQGLGMQLPAQLYDMCLTSWYGHSCTSSSLQRKVAEVGHCAASTWPHWPSQQPSQQPSWGPGWPDERPPCPLGCSLAGQPGISIRAALLP
jgi:hypothetical protein